MKIKFYGAAKEVTGSCFMVEAGGKTVLVDCGMQQGSDKKNDQQLLFDAVSVDYMLVTHAHIDHSGRVPLLVKNGYAGKIYATSKTCDLMKIMLMDSAHIQQMDAEWENRKSRRASKKTVEPLYSSMDVEDTIRRFSAHPYGETVGLCDNISFRFSDAGHLLGSASIELWITENGLTKKIVFSGDIGNVRQPIILDPHYYSDADFVLMESTYGNRSHLPSPDYTYDLAKIIDETLASGGNVVFPAFAVGRTQELLYFIREMKERKLVRSLPDFKVYVDSPLAAAATGIYDTDLQGYADEETAALLAAGYNPIKFDGLYISESVDDSRRLNTDHEPKVIISASGMCDAGRIRHHLKHNLWRSECSVVFVGFQAEGTLGRMLIDGMTHVKLLGEEISVRAKIHNFRGLSAHADQEGLLKWIGSFEKKPEHVFVVHGEEKTADFFAESLREQGFSCHAPNWQEVYDLATRDILASGLSRSNIDYSKGSAVFARLQAAGNQLIEVISENRYVPNKDISKFTAQVLELAKRWDRD